MLLPTIEREKVPTREGLEKRGFPKCNRPVLARMKKSSLRRVVASTRNDRRYIPPSHPSVHVVEALSVTVAGQRKPVWCICAAAAILRYMSNSIDDVLA